MTNFSQIQHLLVVLIVSVFIGLLTESCEYEPSGSNFTYIQEPSGENAILQLNINDTIIYAQQGTEFQYDVRFVTQEVSLVEFYIDGTKSVALEDPAGSFFLSITKGKHRLDIVVYVKTESGSIADKLNAEAFTYNWSWTLYVDETGSSLMSIASLEEEAGSLKLQWEESEASDFLAYEIIKQTDEGALSMATITDRAITSFIDTFYIGGEISYYIILHREYNSPVTTKTDTYITDPYELSIRREDGNRFILSWKSCIFYYNFGTYKLYSNEEGAGPTLIFESDEVNDTTYSFTVNENYRGTYSLEYIPAFDPLSGLNCSCEIYYLPGTKVLPDFTSISQPAYDPYRAYTSEFYYDASIGSIIDHKFADCQGLFAVSPQSRYFLAGKSLYERSGESYSLKVDLPNLPDEFLWNDTIRISLPVNPSLAYFEFGNYACLYNLWDDRIYSEHNGFNHGFFAATGDMVSFIRNNELVFYSTPYLNSPIYQISGCSTDPIYISHRQMYIQVNGAIELWDFLTWTKLNTFPVVNGKMLAYDPVSATFLNFSEQSLFVYDAEDMSLLYEKWIGDYYLLTSGRFAYLDKTVFLRGKTPGNAVMIQMDF